MEFRVLGPLEALASGGPVVLGSTKQRAVLAVLLLQAGRVVSAEQLINDLWGDRPPASAGNALWVHVAGLRRALEPARQRGAPSIIVTRAPGYLIDIEPEQLDLARFERLVAEGRQALAGGAPEKAAELLRQALGLWRGPALANLAAEPFAHNQAARLEEQRLAALEDRIDADLANGDHGKLVGELETLTAAHPLRERLRGQLMLTLYRSGRQAEALEVYRQTRTTLANELAIDPSPALQQLERAILSQDPGLELPAPAGRQPQISNLPARNLAFTGRDHQLATLQRQLAASTPAVVVQPQAMHGLGGVGKTQLALEHAHRHQGDYDLVWWVAAERPATIPAQLAALARRLDIPEHADQAETIQRLWDALRQRDRWLLVFDNADHPSDLQPWWPPGSGRVLVTSRHPIWGGLATPVEVDVLSRAEAIAFLRRRLGSDDSALGRLAEALGDLPLALEQAAAYLEETASTADAYLQLLGDRARELLALGHPTTIEQTIATVWRVALDRLRRQTPAAEDLLVLLAFLGADDIPRDLPSQHPDLLPPRLRVAVGDPLGYQQTVAVLRLLALVAASKDGEQLSVHRLVQAVVRHSLEPDAQQRWAGAAVRLVLAAFPDDSDEVGAWPRCARLLPHALTATDHASSVAADPDATARLLNGAGRYLWGRAELRQGRQLLERALAIREARLGPDHLDVAQSLNDLGNVLRELGDLPAARAALERALSIREARLGADHPDVADSLTVLGFVLHDLGELPAARTAHQRALAIRAARLGPDHRDTAYSLANLGAGLRELGDLDHARPLLEQALAVFEARLGPDHPDVARSLDNLGLLLADLGELPAARDAFERALSICEARLGADHPDTAWSLNNLGNVLRDQGDLDGARTLLERALAVHEARLGPDHPDTAASLNNLGAVLRQMGDLDGAHILFERALSICEARLGPDHPDTAWSLNNLGLLLADLGELPAARDAFERALSICEARLGADHPDTAWSLNNLGNVLRDQGDLDGARTLLERALAVHEGRLGADHPHTQRSRRDLAAVVAELENRG